MTGTPAPGINLEWAPEGWLLGNLHCGKSNLIVHHCSSRQNVAAAARVFESLLSGKTLLSLAPPLILLLSGISVQSAKFTTYMFVKNTVIILSLTIILRCQLASFPFILCMLFWYFFSVHFLTGMLQSTNPQVLYFFNSCIYLLNFTSE